MNDTGLGSNLAKCTNLLQELSPSTVSEKKIAFVVGN